MWQSNRRDTSITISNNTIYMANVYDVSTLTDVYGSINKVMFYSGNVGSSYKVYIAPVGNDGTMPSLSSFGSVLAFGNVDKEGYKTVEFEEPYELNENVDKYAVIVKFVQEDNYYQLSAENPQPHPRRNYGESYVYMNGGWTDLCDLLPSDDESGNFCIRPTLVRKTPITQNSTLSVNQVRYQGEDLTVGLNLNGNLLYSIKKNGNVMLYEDSEFTRTTNSVTFKKSFLDGLSNTTGTNIVFDFTDGATQTLTILPKAQLDNVTISGKRAKGQTLTATVTNEDGVNVPDGSVSYQWQSSEDAATWTNITGATSSTYTAVEDDLLKYIRVTVSANNNSALQYPKTVVSAPTQTPIILYGDVDLDKRVSSNDITLIQKYCAKIVDLTETQLYAADVNGDGVVSIFDTSAIQRYLTGDITSFPVEQN